MFICEISEPKLRKNFDMFSTIDLKLARVPLARRYPSRFFLVCRWSHQLHSRIARVTIQMERVQSPMFDGADRRGYNRFCTVMNTAIAALPRAACPSPIR